MGGLDDIVKLPKDSQPSTNKDELLLKSLCFSVKASNDSGANTQIQTIAGYVTYTDMEISAA